MGRKVLGCCSLGSRSFGNLSAGDGGLGSFSSLQSLERPGQRWSNRVESREKAFGPQCCVQSVEREALCTVLWFGSRMFPKAMC